MVSTLESWNGQLTFPQLQEKVAHWEYLEMWDDLQFEALLRDLANLHFGAKAWRLHGALCVLNIEDTPFNGIYACMHVLLATEQ